MAKKIKALKADVLKFLQGLEDAVKDVKTASAVGFAVRQRMLELISRGISPIEGRARFPEYKNVTIQRGRKQSNRQLRKLSRTQRNIARQLRKNGTRGAIVRNFNASARSLAKAARTKVKKGYPFNTPQYRAGTKRPRPVNLFLTGDFLRALALAVKTVANKAQIEIGWWDPKQAIKEKGHREGAGGQPPRPTLPGKGERWAQVIQLDIMRVLREAVSKAAKSARKG